MKKIFSLIIITLFVSGCIQNKDSNLFTIADSQERKYAEETLEEVLTKNKDHNFINSDTNIIETPEIAVKVAEPILFGIYGRKNIINKTKTV
ncbi:hypothetical protein ASG22_00355 [Chryseobacterium sp. Leaf405]|uniref:lipoprotein n=1 Tax=Chryseobacterium sp. Leaf405 TaxID=1736367 RepID=UPI000701AB47|nr:membrane lipoprotein lipid attachment site-containing protein [Chryseobacterium sp. Leaf405]KQT35519.1 hypothetical protein ASG22_00355 [Chryseobacterium sp. Leaf405]